MTSIFESYCHHIKKCCLFLPVHQASSIKLDHPIQATQLQITIRFRKFLHQRKPFFPWVTLKRKARSWHRGVALGSNTSSWLTQQMRGRWSRTYEKKKLFNPAEYVSPNFFYGRVVCSSYIHRFHRWRARVLEVKNNWLLFLLWHREWFVKLQKRVFHLKMFLTTSFISCADPW